MAEQTNLPSIPPPNEANLVAFARAVKEALEVRLGRRGQGLDAMVTFRDLDKVQMVQGDGRGGVAALRPPPPIGDGYDPALDTTPPPAPTGVKVSGAVRNIILEWDGPPSTYRNPAYVEIWRSSTNNLNDAAQIGQSGSTMYVDNVGEGQARYYWVRYVSQANVTGPWSAAGNAGAQGATSLDVSYTLGLLTSNGFGDPASQSPFVQLDAPVTINGVEVPAGTYLHQAWVANGTITRLKVADAAIDDAKVANLSAAKLTAGDGTIGGILKSAAYISGVTGWAIHRDGWAEFANATVRGTIYADTGWFKGQIIGGGAATYTSGVGMWTGVDAGAWKFRLGAASGGRRITWDGAKLIAGDPSGPRMEWDESALQVFGADNALLLFVGGESAFIDSAMIGAIIQSDNYVPGEAGWIINKSGFAEFQGAEFRGNIKGSVIEGSTIIASNIVRITEAGPPWYTYFASTNVISGSGAWVETYRGGKDNADAIIECLSGILNIYPYNAGPSGVENLSRFIDATATISVDALWDTAVVARGTEFNAYIYLTDEAGNNVETLLSYDYRYGGLNTYTSNGLRVSGLYSSYSYDDESGTVISGSELSGLRVTGSIVRSWSASNWAGRRFRLKVVFRTWRGTGPGTGYVRLSAVNHRLG